MQTEPQDDEIAVRVAEEVRMPNLAAVELPFAVKPDDSGVQKGLSFIGGIEELSKVTADEERALKLHMRPKDPLCRPLVAQRNAADASSFVFKVKRRRLRPRADAGDGMLGQAESTPWSIASVEAIGAVHTSFTFDSLADAQFFTCRPREVKVEESIEDHIEEARTRAEPMELVPNSFLPSFPRVSQESRQEKIIRKEKKDNAAIKLERGELLVYHRFGEAAKQRTKLGATLIREAKAVEPLFDQIDSRWGAGRLPGRENRPSRLRKGVSGHNEVREQQVLLVHKIGELFEKRPMYSMQEIENHLPDQSVYTVRDLVPAVAYYYCNGPWRSRWVRFGYTPEDHPTARFDQLMEFRISPGQLRLWTQALGQTRGMKSGKSKTPKKEVRSGPPSSTPTKPPLPAPPAAAAMETAPTAEERDAPTALATTAPGTAATEAADTGSGTPSAPPPAATGTVASTAASGASRSSSSSGGGGGASTAPNLPKTDGESKKSKGEGDSSGKKSESSNEDKNEEGATAAHTSAGSSRGGLVTVTTATAAAAAAAAPLPTGKDDPSAVGNAREGETGDENVQEEEEEEEEEEESEGDKVAGGAKREEVDETSRTGRPASEDRPERGDGEVSTPGFETGGVLPEIGLTAKTKGRFASQLILNGRRVSVRNRVLIRECPFREVQELVLKAPRLDRPGIVTGWWQPSTVEKMRTLMIDGISALVGFKEQEVAAAATAATASSTCSTATSDADAGESPTATAAAAGETKEGAISQQGQQEQPEQQQKSGAPGNSRRQNVVKRDVTYAPKNPFRTNMTTEDFTRMMEAAEKDIKVVKVPVPALVPGGTTGGEDHLRTAKKKSFPGTGARSGTGRTRVGVGGAKKVAGSKRPAADGRAGRGGSGRGDSPARAGGGRVIHRLSRDVDRAVVRSDIDSDETDSDSVNSSDLVDSTEDSWDSQEDETSDEDDDDEEGMDDDGGAEERTRNDHPRLSSLRSGVRGGVDTAAGGGSGRKRAAPKRDIGARSKRT